jgi:hypothetical protein
VADQDAVLLATGRANTSTMPSQPPLASSCPFGLNLDLTVLVFTDGQRAAATGVRLASRC